MNTAHLPARVVFAPDSYKGTIRATDAADALAEGWARVRPEDTLECYPMADGGEGTLQAFESAIPGSQRITLTVHGPTGTPVEAEWLLLPDSGDGPTGVVELANTSGIELLGGVNDLRPLDADTRGFGEAIVDALDHGVSRLVLAIGSSASSDGGAGVLRALGVRLLDTHGAPVAGGARGLADIVRIDFSGLRPPPPRGVLVLTDVTSPLLGRNGAAAMFAPQKGADQAQIAAIEDALTKWASLVVDADPAAPGAGAAGGTGFGLVSWGATCVSGSRAVSALIDLPRALEGATLVVTGEGSFDAQSVSGKAPSVVIEHAAQLGIPVAVVAGRVGVRRPDVRTISLTELAGSSSAAMADPTKWLTAAGEELAHTTSNTHPTRTRN